MSSSESFLGFSNGRSFADVPVDDGIPTTEFLEASEYLVKLFDILGSTAFGAVISDMNGNIKKIRDRQTAEPGKSSTLQLLTAQEFEEKKKKATATEGLLWLSRGLDFTSKALRHNLSHPTEELVTSFQHSYDGTLKKHHNFVVKGIFSVALKATPYRKDFYEKIGVSTADPKDDERLTNWLSSLEKVVSTIQGFYGENKDFGF
ncbi:hypothetical protein TWF481_005888 [Arthrobotrys musiformis]|uniref:Glycolipid transfer protein domain-containing protein n=1 Tax=Arthrobotrys musiformis TaxID=47236 RepID=A0AAV9WGA1_9PEZI